MNCPKCGQATIIPDDEGDDHCYMCSYNSSTRMPTPEEVERFTKRLYGSYAPEPKFQELSFDSRSLRESLPILKRRSINWNVRDIKIKVNKEFNRMPVTHGSAK